MTKLLLPWACLAAVGFHGLHRAFPWPYPPYHELVTQRNGLRDISLVAGGFRALAADLAWIDLLQYVGGGFLPGEDRSKAYAELLPMTLRVTRIDPFFRRAYLFSASMLAFFRNIDRPREALTLIGEGIRTYPADWSMRTYAAAMGYIARNDFDRSAALLEDAIRQPDCPALVKSILANGYKARGRPADALRIWRMILDDPSAEAYYGKAQREIDALEGRPR